MDPEEESPLGLQLPAADVAADEVGVLNHMEERRKLAAKLQSDPEFEKRYIEEQEQLALEKLVKAYEDSKAAATSAAAPPSPLLGNTSGVSSAPRRTQIRARRILTQEQLDNIIPDPPLDDFEDDAASALRGSGVTIMHVENLTINVYRK